MSKNITEFLEILGYNFDISKGISELLVIWGYNFETLQLLDRTPLGCSESSNIVISKPREIVPTTFNMESDTSRVEKSEGSNSGRSNTPTQIKKSSSDDGNSSPTLGNIPIDQQAYPSDDSNASGTSRATSTTPSEASSEASGVGYFSKYATAEELDANNMRALYVPNWMRSGEHRVINRDNIMASRAGMTGWAARVSNPDHDAATCPVERDILGRVPDDKRMTYNGLFTRIFERLNADNGTNGAIPAYGYGMPPSERQPNECTPFGEDNPKDKRRGLHGPGFRAIMGNNPLDPYNEAHFRWKWEIPDKDDTELNNKWREASNRWVAAKQQLTANCSWTDLREHYIKHFFMNVNATLM